VSPRWLLFDGGHFWRYIKVMKAEEVNGNDLMADNYDHGGEGDTPAFLYLISASLGLNDPKQPSQGSWGTRFQAMPSSYPRGYYTTCGVPQSELERWIPDAKNSFLARMKWATQPPTQVNHAPVAAVGKDTSNKVIYLSASPASKLRFDASASFDRDGDKLDFKWFHYAEAGSYPQQLTLKDAHNSRVELLVPKDLGNEEIHLVLEVRDQGKPSLVSYKRIVIRKKGVQKVVRKGS
jgi:hypothetical protein